MTVLNSRCKALLVVFCALSICGCSSWTVIREKPPLSDQPKETTAAVDAGKLKAFLVDYRAFRDGTEAPAPQDVIQRLRNDLARTGVFSSVETGKPTEDADKCVLISFRVNERFENNAGANYGKLFLTILSCYLLMPVLTYDYDFWCDISMECRKPDESLKQYSAKAWVTVKMQPFASKSWDTIAKGPLEAGNLCIYSIINQLSRDAPVFADTPSVK